jgi:hypothetical protein
MPIQDGVTSEGSERERQARITPSDVADAMRQAEKDAGPLGVRMLDAIVDDDFDSEPVTDPG